MKLFHLFEAPISHFSVHNMDHPGGTFPPIDRRNLQRPEYVQRVVHRFERVGIDFRMYFINQREVEYLDPDNSFSDQFSYDMENYLGIISPEVIEQKFRVKVEPSPNSITVVFVSNANTENSVSMTPWIMAHRFAHAIFDEEAKGSPRKLIGSLSLFVRVKDYLPSARSGDLGFSLRSMLTMKSARTGSLLSGEALVELFSQYLMTGKTIFKVPEFGGARYSMSYAELTPRQIAAVKRALPAIEAHFNKTMAAILDFYKGKVVLSV